MKSLRLTRVIAAGVTAGAGLLLTAPGAVAAEQVTIDHVESLDGRVSAVVTVDGLGANATLDSDTVGVRLDGTPVSAEVSPVTDGVVERSTILVLDASKSMRRAGKFAAALDAVDAYLTSAPDDVKVGLVAFAGTITAEVEPTTDRGAITGALDGLELELGTAAHDAMRRGVELAGTEGVRSLLVLSDGADVSSKATLDNATESAKQAGMVVDVVSLGTSDKAKRLDTIAEVTGGQVIPAERSSLEAAFQAQADSLNHQLLIEFDAPDGKSEADLEVTIQAAGQALTDDAFINIDSAPVVDVDVVESGKALVGSTGMLAGAVALFLGLIGLVAIAITGPGSSRSSAEKRMQSYFSGTGEAGKRSKGPTPTDLASLRSVAVATASKVVNRDMETRISQRLTGAGSALSASEWVLLHAGIALGGALVGFLLDGPALGVMALALGAVGPWVYLKVRHSRRLAQFNAQLADTLGLMAGGLQAGLSLPQAVDTVVQEGAEPMAGELRRALVEQRLGVDISDALDGVGERMDSEDFGWVVMAIRIQREVGGNLAEILHTVADTLREREYLRRQVKALSAEGRLSGYILVALPILIFFYMHIANPDYIKLLYTTLPGFFLLAMGIGLLSVGAWAMNKLATVEV